MILNPKKENNLEQLKEEKDVEVKAPVAGEVLSLSEVKDEAFSSGTLGKGIAVIPEEGKIYAPCDGVVTALYPTGHAIGITSVQGAEILIHIGMDTVTLNGECFHVHVKEGQEVKTGQLLIEADLDGIRSHGLEITTPVVVTNPDQFNDVKLAAAKQVTAGDAILYCINE